MSSSAAMGIRGALRRLAWFLPTCVVGSGCDLQTKSWAVQTLSELPTRSVMVLEPWLEWSLAYNSGTAFSVIADVGDWARWALGLFSVLFAFAVAAVVLRSKLVWYEAVGLGLIAGGAIGNGFDRLLRSVPGGGTVVVDFIKVNYPWGGSWPTFNVADILLPAGAILLIIAHFRRGSASPSRVASPGSASARSHHPY